MYSLLSCFACATFPANNGLKKWSSSFKTPTLTQKVIVIYKLTFAWASHFFSWRHVFVKVGLLSKKKCVIYNVYSISSKVPYSYLVPLSWQHSFRQMLFGRCCFLQRLNAWLQVAIVFKQFSKNSRKNIASKYAVYPLKMQHSSQKSSAGLYDWK